MRAEKTACGHDPQPSNLLSSQLPHLRLRLSIHHAGTILGFPTALFGALYLHIISSARCNNDVLRPDRSTSTSCGWPPGKPMPAWSASLRHQLQQAAAH